MTTRRKTGGARKQAAPRPKVAASRSRAPKHAARVPKHGKAGAGRGANGTSRAVAASGAHGARRAAAHDASRAAFPADCTIAQAGEMKTLLAPLLAQPSCVTLDLSNIRRVDTAGLQVLTAFIRERHAAGREVQCQGASEALIVTADVLGLGALFGPVRDHRLAEAPAGHA